MPFDAFFTQAISSELDVRLRNGRIERIVHPQKDRIILEGRHPYPGIDFFLLLSIHPQYARVQLCGKPKNVPKQPSAFCMLLRKHLSGGRILSVEATPWERIIIITFEVYAGELGLTKRRLILEMLGRRSNLILTEESGLIIDAVKREDGERERSIIPGVTYLQPSKPTSWTPLISSEQLQVLIDRSPADTPLFKLLYTQLLGISPFIAKELSVRAGYSPEMPLDMLDATAGSKITHAIAQLLTAIKDPMPYLLRQPSGEIIDFSAFHPTQSGFILENASSLNQLVADSIGFLEEQNRIRSIQTRLRRVVGEKIAKLTTKLEKQTDELTAAEDAETFRLYGELLTFSKAKLVKGQSQVELVNYYDPQGTLLSIPLRPDLSPNENIQAYFKKYQKAKKGRTAIGEQIQATQAEVSYHEGLLTILNDPLTLGELVEIEDELESLGLIRRPKVEKKQSEPSSPHRFVSSEGIPIDVGRNNQQNDRLTFKIASPRDTWMHTQNIPGSHVLIRDDGQGFTEVTLLEAANLAAWHSKARRSTKIPVDYTSRRHVRKPPGSHPGFVLYDHVKTIIITPDPSILQRLGVSLESGNDN